RTATKPRQPTIIMKSPRSRPHKGRLLCIPFHSLHSFHFPLFVPPVPHRQWHLCQDLAPRAIARESTTRGHSPVMPDPQIESRRERIERAEGILDEWLDLFE